MALTPQRTTPLWSRRFVGRSKELAWLHDARRALARGRGSVTLIDGEAGIGKSRLVEEALREIGSGQTRVLHAECVVDSTSELWPFRFALGRMWTSACAQAAPLALRTAAQLIPDEAGDLAARYAGPTLGKDELFAGLAAALAVASAKRGTILVIEDIHWADRTTLEFLAVVGSQLRAMRLMVVATCRSEEIEASVGAADILARILRLRGLRHLPLQPLQRAEVSEMIDGALDGHDTISARTKAAIIERCEGNPFFAEELLKTAVERGPGPHGLPMSIRASIRHRLAGLSPDDRAVLDVAAVLGTQFDRRVLARVTSSCAHDVTAALTRARAANLVDDVDPSTSRFHHALVRQAIYDALPAATTQTMHRRVLSVLEQRAGAEADVESLAYHARQADDAARLLCYSERAGDRAATLGMFSDARAHYERILPAIDETGDRARIFERIGTIAKAQGDFTAAIDALAAALALREERAELDDAARIAVAIAVERSNSGGDAIADLERFRVHHDARLSAPARDGVLVFLARIMTALGQFERASALLHDASSPEQMEPRVRANYLTCRLNAAEHAGQAAAWHDAAREMIALAPHLPPLMRSIQLTNVAQTGLWFGERKLVAAALADAQTIAREWQFDGIFAFSQAVEAHLRFLEGDLARAREALDGVARAPHIAPAQVLAARIGPHIAAALDDAGLAARCFAGDAVRAAVREDSIDAMYAEAGILAVARPGDLARSRARFAARLRAIGPGTFLPPTVALIAARELDPDLSAAMFDTRYGSITTGALATHELVRAILAARTSNADIAAANAAALHFCDAGWPLFEAFALEAAERSAEALVIYERCGALSGVRRLQAGAPRASGSLLTAREGEIAALIVRGQTNARIAQTLGIGTKTVEKHVSNIFLKLNARSRAQIAAYVADQDARAVR